MHKKNRKKKNNYFYVDYYFNQKKKNEISYSLNTKRNKIYKINIEKEYFNNDNNSLKRITEYKDGYKHGIEKIFFQNNIVFKQCYYKYGIKLKNEFVNYNNGCLHYLIKYNGSEKTIKKFFKNEISNEISIKNDILHGQCYYYLFNTLKKSINFNNGNMTGIVKNYKFFGIDEILSYSNNKKNGIFINYNFIKQIRIIGNYNQDKLNGILFIFSNKKIIKTIKLIKGNIHGNYIECKHNLTIYPFKNNQLNGYFKEFNLNNKIKYKIKYLDNNFANIFKKYDYFGNLEFEILFVNCNEYIIKKYKRNIILYSLYKINGAYYIIINGKKICLN